MFKSNNNPSGDYVTRGEASDHLDNLRREAREAFVSHDDAVTHSQALSALEERVQDLEKLAAELRRGGRPVTPVDGPAAERGVTFSEAQGAYEQINNRLDRLFTEAGSLGRKIDNAVSGLTSRAQATATAVQREVGGDVQTSNLDTHAIAFGLSEVKRQVVLAVAQGTGTDELARHYAGTVQYFSDVLAKADPSFDADAFKRQAGVGNGGTAAVYTPQHP